jgi:ribulose 1,5-bisphosphate synthetase/thiazole synthase
MAQIIPSVSKLYADPIISPRNVDDVRPLKVIVIGAGVSGIVAGIKLPQRIKNLDLVIYDKNEEVGGTWFENNYPGIACGMLIQTKVTVPTD